MNADAFRHFYDYHFAENRKIWDDYIPSLSQVQFTMAVDYSHGSVCNQIVHIISTDDTWFSALRGVELPPPVDPGSFGDRKIIRAHWDEVEHSMRVYLAGLGDNRLFRSVYRLRNVLVIGSSRRRPIFRGKLARCKKCQLGLA